MYSKFTDTQNAEILADLSVYRKHTARVNSLFMHLWRNINHVSCPLCKFPNNGLSQTRLTCVVTLSEWNVQWEALKVCLLWSETHER